MLNKQHPRYPLGNVGSGDITLDFNNGSYQVGDASADVRFVRPTGDGVLGGLKEFFEGRSITMVLTNQSGSAINVDFDLGFADGSKINLPSDSGLTVPFELPAYHIVKFSVQLIQGFCWLQSLIKDLYTEND